VPRYYHDGSQLDCPAIVKHPQFGSALRVPRAFVAQRGAFVPAKPGSIVLALAEVGLFVCEPGGFVDVPQFGSDPRLTIDEHEQRVNEVVKAHAPHLLTEQEAVDKGVIKPRVAYEPAQPAAADKPSGGSGARGPKQN